MRTKHNRLACENRFYGILAAVRGEALPNEHHSSDAVPALKITSRIEENTIRIYRPVGKCFAGERHAQSHCPQVRADFLQSLDMTRRDEQSQRRKLLAQLKKNSDQDFFFTIVRT